MEKHIRGWYRLNPVVGGILLCILMVFTFWQYFVEAIIPPEELITIDHAVFSSTPELNVDRKNILLSEQSLPDDWFKTLPGVSEGWYQAILNLEHKPDGLWAIYLPRVKMNAEIYLNELLIGRVGEIGQSNPYADPFGSEANQPYYFTLPDKLLMQSDNDLKIHAQAKQGTGFLGKIYFGEDSLLQPIYKNRYSLLVTSRLTITAAMLAIAVLMSVLWILRRQDSVYGWYALMLYAWSAHNFFVMGLDVPLSGHAQYVLSLLTLGWFVVFMVKATHDYLGQQFPLREKVMWSVAGVGSLAIIFSHSLPWSLLVTHQLWSSFMLMLAGYALLDFTVKFREREDLQNPLILPAGFSMLVFGVHDWLLIMQLIPGDDGRLLHFSAPVAVSVFAFLLLERFAKTLKRAESLNLELEQRVAEKHHELELNYQRLKEMEHKQLLADERERFMKEIHDGVGGHLVSMLSMVRSGRQDTQVLVRSIETTLDDLRIMIDSLSPQEQDIASLLGAMRVRIEPQLESGDLKLHWQVGELPVIADFGPHKALQVMRIVQEAITNVIRHAQAQRIFIKAFVENQDTNDVIIEIVDDGCGFLSNEKPGRGLGNMHQRAADIGAGLDIVNTNPGTTIRLTFRSHKAPVDA